MFSQVKKLYRGQGWVTFFTYFRYWEDIRYQRIEKMLPQKGLIIDLGCGYGIFSNYLALTGPKRKILGIELNKDKIRFADKGFTNISFLVEDVTKIDIPQAEVFVLICVLHHLNSFQAQEKLLDFCVKKLKKNGLLLIDEVDNRPWWKYLITRLADFLLYPRDKIYFRFQPDMLKLLKRFPLTVEVKNVDGRLAPFSQLIYICRKK